MPEEQIELFTYPGLAEKLRDVLSSGEKVHTEEVLVRLGMKHLDRRELRRLCEDAVMKYGIPIGSSTKGLFLVTDQKSFEEARTYLFKQMVAYSKRIEGLERAYGIDPSIESIEEEEAI